MTNKNKKIALLSVFDKEGIVEFAKSLQKFGYDIYASGGTAKTLAEGGVENTDVATLVGGGAILGHKVVTLSREIHAGLLADRVTDKEEMEKLGIPFIDLVCGDLYPLELAIKETPNDEANILHRTDMGGPAMLSSAAKGRRIVICDPKDRQKVIEWLIAGEPEKDEFIRALAAKADYTISKYRLLSARFHSKGKYSGAVGESYEELRYGENAPQAPAFLFKADTKDALSIDNFTMHTGNPSLINITDIDRTLQTITHIMGAMDLNDMNVKYAGVAVKHGNPCGAAFGDTREEAVKRTIDGNRRSIFGGTVMLNFKVDEEIAELLVRYGMADENNSGRRRPLDVVAASEITEEAIKILARQNDRCLVITNPALNNLSKDSLDTSVLRRQIRGGWLEQPNYTFLLDLKSNDISKYGSIENNSGLDKDTLLGFAVASTSNSNTITLVKDGTLIGNGVGQQDRVGAVELALNRARQAGHEVKGAVAVSDSFFPFPDAPALLKDAGVARILATSGSINDKATIELFDGKGEGELLHIPDKIGRMFFGH